MAVYRNIQMSFWTDAKVIDDFTPEDRYFYLYLMTNPHTNLCGCYEISIKQIADETGYTKETVEKLINRMVTVHQILSYSKRTKELLLLNWHKYNWNSSDKFRNALRKEIDAVKDDTFKAYLDDIFKGMDTVSIPYGYGMDTTVTVTDTVYDTDTVSVSDKADRKVKNNIPTVEDVREYCMERGNNVDAEQFVDYYQARGWKLKTGVIKDWRAAVRTWERNEYNKPVKQQMSQIDYLKSQIGGGT